MYQVYRQTMGNKPLLFGGGSPDTGVSEDLTGVEFHQWHPPRQSAAGGTGEKSGGQCGRTTLLELVRL